MADSTLKRGADRAARGVWGNFIVPGLMGAAVTAFFFQFVPEAMGVLHDDFSFEQAMPLAWDRFLAPYKDVFVNGKSGDVYLFGWPIIGAIAGIFLTKIFTSD